jgi:hypothetical protein
MDDRGSIPDRGKGIFFFSLPSLVFEPNKLLVQWELEALSPRVKRPGREIDHS